MVRLDEGMRRMREAAAKWKRVSTKGQDEASQDPDLVKWCDDHDYDVKKEYVVHGLSAYHGKHQKTLDAMFTDMAYGLFTVLVVWKQDRIERRGMEAALNLVSRAKQAGGRIEFVTQPHLNKLNDMGGRISYAIMAEVANAESETKSDRIKAKHRNLKDKGSYVGKPPWGYEIVKVDGIKTLEPTAEGREWIPAIYRMAINGESRINIVRTLKAANLKTKNGSTEWTQQSVSVIINNPAYMGMPRNNDTVDIEALVSPSEWQEATYALKGRSTWQGRGTTKHAKTLLTPLCGNPECMAKGDKPAPMYRVPLKVFYYRCNGHGDSKSCGAPMIPCKDLDSAITEAMLSDESLRVITEFVPGDVNADELARVQEKIAAAAREKDFLKVAELSGEAIKLTEQPTRPAGLQPKKTNTTVAAYFASLDTEGRRRMLAEEYEIIARRVIDEDGVRRPQFTMVHKSLLVEMQPA